MLQKIIYNVLCQHFLKIRAPDLGLEPFISPSKIVKTLELSSPEPRIRSTTRSDVQCHHAYPRSREGASCIMQPSVDGLRFAFGRKLPSDMAESLVKRSCARYRGVIVMHSSLVKERGTLNESTCEFSYQGEEGMARARFD
jgi:hypothetical protein